MRGCGQDGHTSLQCSNGFSVKGSMDAGCGGDQRSNDHMYVDRSDDQAENPQPVPVPPQPEPETGGSSKTEVPKNRKVAILGSFWIGDEREFPDTRTKLSFTGNTGQRE